MSEKELSESDVQRIAKAVAAQMGGKNGSEAGKGGTSSSSGKKRMPAGMKDLLGSLVRKGADE